MRMFVAVVPPTETTEAIAEFLAPRRESDSSVRWTEPFQWHLTLAFMPEVPEAGLEDLEERISRVAQRRQPFSVRLAGAGAFPSVALAKVVWLGVQPEPEDALQRLAGGVRAAAGKSGAKVMGGKFRPHLTLGRLRKGEDATRWVRVLETFEGATWPAERIELIESRMPKGKKGRPQYVPVADFTLRGTAAS